MENCEELCFCKGCEYKRRPDAEHWKRLEESRQELNRAFNAQMDKMLLSVIQPFKNYK